METGLPEMLCLEQQETEEQGERDVKQGAEKGTMETKRILIIK